MAAGENSGVARVLRERGQAALEPPRERVEPEHRAIQKREPLNQRIPAARMLPLVQQHGVQLRG